MHGFLSFDHTWRLASHWLTHHESLLIFVAILLEESGIPMPLPADLAMALAGYRVAQGQMSLLSAFLIGQSATLIGSSILYWVGRRGGRPLLFRYGQLLHLSAHRIAQVERLITRLGALAVIIGRQIPGLRLAAPLACGVFRVRYRIFVPAMIFGSSVYMAIFLALGMWGGPAVLGRLQASGMPLRFMASSLLLVVAITFLRQLGKRSREVAAPAYRATPSRRRSLEAALLAGIGSSALVGLVFTWLLELISLIAQTPPNRTLLQWLESGSALPLVAAGLDRERLQLALLVAAFPFQMVGHVLLATLYAFGFERRLRGSAALRGLQFALLPWLLSCLVVFPFLGAGLFGVRLGAGPLPAFGELVRYAVFGLALGSLYRLFRLARQPRLHAGHRHGHRHHPAPATARPAPATARPAPATARPAPATARPAPAVAAPDATRVPALVPTPEPPLAAHEPVANGAAVAQGANGVHGAKTVNLR